jgi:hypothetical protein
MVVVTAWFIGIAARCRGSTIYLEFKVVIGETSVNFIHRLGFVHHIEALAVCSQNLE